MIIYKATSPSGKSYIGKTSGTLERRKYRHCHVAENGSKLLFHNALRKYGSEAFKWEIITDKLQCGLELNRAEALHIARDGTKFPNGYNLTDGGDGMSGFSHSEETRRKISIANKGKKRTEEARRKMSIANKGKTLSDETCRKISLTLKGKMSIGAKGKPSYKRTEEHRRKMSLANKGKKRTEETRRKMSIAAKKRYQLHRGKEKK